MTISVIRDSSNSNITTGNFCLFGANKSGGSGGSLDTVLIDLPPDTEFPLSNKLVAFKVPSEDYRFAININGQNILGSLNEVVSELYESYGIYTSYTKDSDVIFTYNGEDSEFCDIAIKGVSDAVGDIEFYQDVGLCQTFQLSNGVFLFSLIQSGDYPYLPLSESDGLYYEFAPMDAQLNYKVYNSPIDVLPIRTNVNLKNWYLSDEFTQTVDRNYVVTYYQPYERSVTLGEIIDNRDSEIEFSYQHTYRNLVMHTLSASLFGYGIGDSSTWSSNIGQMMVGVDYWFDFTNDPTRSPFIIKKGYPLYLGIPY